MIWLSRRRVVQSQCHRAALAAFLLCIRVISHPFPGSILLLFAAIHMVEAEAGPQLLTRTKSEVLFASVPLLAHFEPLLAFAHTYSSKSTYKVSVLVSSSVFQEHSRKEKRRYQRLKRRYKLNESLVPDINFLIYHDYGLLDEISRSLASNETFYPEPIALSLSHQHSAYSKLLLEYDVDPNDIRNVPSVIVADRYCFGAIAFAQKFSVKLVIFNSQSLLSIDNPAPFIRPPFTPITKPNKILPHMPLLRIINNVFGTFSYSSLTNNVVDELRRFYKSLGLKLKVTELYNQSLIISQTLQDGLDMPRGMPYHSFYHIGAALSAEETQSVGKSKGFLSWVKRERLVRVFGSSRQKLCVIQGLLPFAQHLFARNKQLKVPTVLLSDTDRVGYQSSLLKRLFGNKTKSVSWFSVSKGDYSTVLQHFLWLGSPVMVFPSKLFEKEVGYLVEERDVGIGVDEGTRLTIQKHRSFFSNKKKQVNALELCLKLRISVLKSGFAEASDLISSYIISGNMKPSNNTPISSHEERVMVFFGKQAILVMILLLALVMRLLARTLVLYLQTASVVADKDNFAPSAQVKLHQA